MQVENRLGINQTSWLGEVSMVRTHARDLSEAWDQSAYTEESGQQIRGRASVEV